MAVLRAYGWSDAFTDDQINAALLALNHEAARSDARRLTGMTVGS